MWNLWKDRKDELEKKKEESRRLYGIKIEPQIEKKTSTVSIQRRKGLSKIMEGLLEFLEEDSFVKLSDSDLKNLQFSREIVSRLSGRLSVLSSRLNTLEPKKGGS